jgi:fumarate reductase flavoprotein subunit
MADTSRADHSADVVVVGSGGAGLTAALAALDSAAVEVLILEKAPSPGGNTGQSAGMFAVDSQKRKGIIVSRVEIFREKMLYANWRVDPGLVIDGIDLSGEMVGWLEAKGMRFDNVIEFLREGRAPKVFHSFSPGPAGFIGKTIIETLSKDCLSAGARILYEAPATGLLRDGRGKVTGVTARVGGRCVRVAAGCVVLGTGGFGANKELLHKYFPGHGDVFTLNYPQMTGDGLSMAEEAGAEIDDNMVLLLTGPHHYPWSHVLTLLVRRPDIVLVNRDGRRYCDETIFLDYHTEAGNALSRQPGMSCYGLIDSDIKHCMARSREIVSGMEREAGGNGAWVRDLDAELEAGVERGTVLKGGDWDDVGRQMGAGPGILASTVATYNTHCAHGWDNQFFKEAGFLHPLHAPPYYAVLGRQGFDTTLGGIKVTRSMEVIDRRGVPVAGLFAAGDCASGWEHENYNLRHPGSALTFALCSGYIAGRQAGKYLRAGTAATAVPEGEVT